MAPMTLVDWLGVIGFVALIVSFIYESQIVIPKIQSSRESYEKIHRHPIMIVIEICAMAFCIFMLFLILSSWAS